MPLFRDDEIPAFERFGNFMQGLATPSRGAGEVMVWRTKVAPGGGPGFYRSVLQIKTDGTVEIGCSKTAPALDKADAIAAMLAPGAPSGCSDHLASVDSSWGEEQCDDSGSGCSIAGPGGPSSLLLGTLVVGVAAWSRRRRRARRRSSLSGHQRLP